MKKTHQKIQSRKRKKTKVTALLEKINLDTAGIDIGATQLWVAVPEDRDEKPIQVFETFTADLHRLANWLLKCEIKTVAMESTGVYWIPVFQILESKGIEVKLANARHVKNVPGRKTDMQDCQWLQQLHTYGLLSGSFRPDNDICVLRSYLRHRENLIRLASTHVQHMHKALTQMNLQIQNVISDMTGKTGMSIIRAILKGERNPANLARLKDPRIQSSEERIAKSLEGDYRKEHLFCLQQAVESYEFYQQQIEECDQQIEAHLKQFEPKVDIEKNPLPKPKKNKGVRRGNAPKFDLRTSLYQISGVDLTQIEGINVSAANIVISEIGMDMSKFPSEKHLASYLGLCPNNQVTGGKVISRKSRKVFNRAAQVLRIAAMSLQRSKSYLGAFYRRMRSHLGPSKAITATARKLACQIYRMLKYGKDYVDRGEDFYEKQYQEKALKYLKKRAKQFGFELTATQELAQGVS